MTPVTSIIVLKALVKHETLTFPDLLLQENLGVNVGEEEVAEALQHLKDQKYVTVLHGVSPATYTITDAGIEASKRLTFKNLKVVS